MCFKNILIIFILPIILLAVCHTTVMAQTLVLSPQSATKNVGEEFIVSLNIDTADKAVAGTDVKMTFDSDILEVVSIENKKALKESGGFFTDGAFNLSGNNIYIAGFFPEQFKTDTGTGTIASFTLKGKKVGTGQMVFACTDQTNDTNILDAQAADIANCSAIKNGSYTFVEASGPTSTGAPTATPTIPTSGLSTPTYFSFGLGALLMVVGLAFIF